MEVYFLDKAKQEMLKCPDETRVAFSKLISILVREGRLEYPGGRKLRGYGIYEMRVRRKGQYRALYGYIGKNEIYILVVFRKKTQKTPQKHINTALSRLSLCYE